MCLKLAFTTNLTLTNWAVNVSGTINPLDYKSLWQCSVLQGFMEEMGHSKMNFRFSQDSRVNQLLVNWLPVALQKTFFILTQFIPFSRSISRHKNFLSGIVWRNHETSWFSKSSHAKAVNPSGRTQIRSKHFKQRESVRKGSITKGSSKRLC